MRNLQIFWGFAPDPNGGAYSAPSYPLAGAGGGHAPSCTHLLHYLPTSTAALPPISAVVQRGPQA